MARNHTKYVNLNNPTESSPDIRNSGYSQAGASKTKRSLKGFNARSSSPQEDIDFNNYTLRQRARILFMSAPLARSAIATNRTNVIGVGLKLKSRVDRKFLGLSAEAADELQKHIEKEFDIWAGDRKGCDAIGVNDFYDQQQLVFQSYLVNGDCFALVLHKDTDPLHPYSLRLHLIEADRVRTPNMDWQYSTEGKNEKTGNLIHDGVEVDSSGAIVAYHIANYYPYSAECIKDNLKFERVQAYGEKTGLPNVLHIMDAERPDQYRGVSYLAPVIEPLLQLRRYTESELTAADIEACYAAFIKVTDGASENPFNSTVPEREYHDPDEYDLSAGTVNVMNVGEDVTFADPKRPNNGFGEFVKHVATLCGAALEIPRELLLKVFEASYSASRAALLEAWKAFRMRRTWFINDFCRPVYEIWFAEAVARGRINAPGFFSSLLTRRAYLGADWIGPAQGMLDPTKEIQAEKDAIAEGFSTHQESTIKLGGGDWNENIEILKSEMEQRRAAGLPDKKDETFENAMDKKIDSRIRKDREEQENG